MPKISVIVPVYKVEHSLRRCVDSILGQTFRDFELILIDDGSPDRSGQICDKYAEKDTRVQVIHQANSGAAAARNRGMEEAGGEYIAFVDSDDTVEPGFLEGLLHAIETYGGDIAVCNYMQTENNMVKTTVFHGFPEGTYLNADEMRKKLFVNIATANSNGYFSLWNKLFRANFIRNHHIAIPSNMSFGEDLCFILDLFSVASGISFTDRILYRYEQSSTGLFAAYRHSRLDDALFCYEKQVSLLNPLQKEGLSLSRLHCKYFYYINQHLSQAFGAGRKDVAELRRTISHPTVKKLFSAILAMTPEENEQGGISPYEQKLLHLVSSGKFGRACVFARYLYDRTCFLRHLKTAKNVLPDLLREKGCCKISSLHWSLRAGGLFLVYPKSKILIHKKAALLIDGKFAFNKPWHGKQNRPATLVVSEGATLSVNGSFTMRDGVYVTVDRGATLSLRDGFLNNGGKISCFSKISLGDDVRLSEDVILRDSDNHEILREGFIKNSPIVIGDHVWIGLRVIILKGVTIGDGSVVAAGALVNKSIPQNTLVGGIPAKEMKNNINWR